MVYLNNNWLHSNYCIIINMNLKTVTLAKLCNINIVKLIKHLLCVELNNTYFVLLCLIHVSILHCPTAVLCMQECYANSLQSIQQHSQQQVTYKALISTSSYSLYLMQWMFTVQETYNYFILLQLYSEFYSYISYLGQFA